MFNLQLKTMNLPEEIDMLAEKLIQIFEVQYSKQLKNSLIDMIIKRTRSNPKSVTELEKEYDLYYYICNEYSTNELIQIEDIVKFTEVFVKLHELTSTKENIDKYNKSCFTFEDIMLYYKMNMVKVNPDECKTDLACAIDVNFYQELKDFCINFKEVNRDYEEMTTEELINIINKDNMYEISLELIKRRSDLF